MLNDKAVRGSNFTCVHAGPMEGWAQFRLEPPDVPLPARGKLFLRNLLGSAGLEMSLNVVPPGKGMPFLHKHSRMRRSTLSSEAEGSSSWTASASTWRKARSCASARQRHEPGGTTPMRRCALRRPGRLRRCAALDRHRHRGVVEIGLDL